MVCVGKGVFFAFGTCFLPTCLSGRSVVVLVSNMVDVRNVLWGLEVPFMSTCVSMCAFPPRRIPLLFCAYTSLTKGYFLMASSNS